MGLVWQNEDANLRFRVEVTYMEIYNEKVWGCYGGC